jgi:hypothetical protein
MALVQHDLHRAFHLDQLPSRAGVVM